MTLSLVSDRLSRKCPGLTDSFYRDFAGFDHIPASGVILDLASVGAEDPEGPEAGVREKAVEDGVVLALLTFSSSHSGNLQMVELPSFLNTVEHHVAESEAEIDRQEAFRLLVVVGDLCRENEP